MLSRLFKIFFMHDSKVWLCVISIFLLTLSLKKLFFKYANNINDSNDNGNDSYNNNRKQ